MLTCTISKDQESALSGLAYWIADLHYLRERFGDEDPELSTVRKTISDCFDHLDRLKVPFWVQNSVICWAEDWRSTKREYLSELLSRKGISVA